jgi:hypothetical protein
MFNERPIRLIRSASIEGLEIPVMDTKKIAPMSDGASPAWASAPHKALWPISCAISIQWLLAAPSYSTRNSPQQAMPGGAFPPALATAIVP